MEIWCAAEKGSSYEESVYFYKEHFCGPNNYYGCPHVKFLLLPPPLVSCIHSFTAFYLLLAVLNFVSWLFGADPLSSRDLKFLFPCWL